jgi:thiaminase/transcriptional activator TenA
MMTLTAIEAPSARLRMLARPVWDQIVAHPYLSELKDGTLPVETFRFYVQQDWLYLQEFTRAAAIIGGRHPDVEGMKFMLEWVQPLVGMEYHFHKKHAAQLELDFNHVTWEMNEANWAYSRHMLAAAHGGSTAEALAALLPCPAVYAHVGALLVQGAPSPNPMYQDWIDFYAPSRDGLSPRIAAIQARFDDVAANLDPATWARCERNYVISSRYEWWFWDTAYRRQMWPV